MRSLGLALAAGALALTATGAAQAVVPPGRAPSIAAAHGVAVGAYPARAPIELYVRLQGRNEAQLDALIAALDTPGSNIFGRFLTPEQFGAYFGAAPRAYATAIGSLRRGGFIVEALPANRSDIIVRAPAATVSAYFQTPIDLRSENGRLFYANRFEPIVPAELGAEAISGLDDYGMHHPEFLRRPASTINGYFSWGPPDIAAAYDLDALYKSKPVLDGSGVTIANATCGAASDSDFATFQKQFPELSRAHLISTAIGGKLQTGCGPYGNGESSLDVDSATGVARGATFHQVVARDSSNGAFDKVYSYIVNNLGSTVHVVTTSWGICEREIQGTPSLTIDEKLYRQAAAEGQAWFSASGDSGTDDCGASKGAVSVDYPGSSPYVISVGGTNVKASIVHGSVTQWLAESTWQYSNSNGASGGGRSILYAKPSYQMGMTPEGRRPRRSRRGAPRRRRERRHVGGRWWPARGRLGRHQRSGAAVGRIARHHRAAKRQQGRDRPTRAALCVGRRPVVCETLPRHHEGHECGSGRQRIRRVPRIYCRTRIRSVHGTRELHRSGTCQSLLALASGRS